MLYQIFQTLDHSASARWAPPQKKVWGFPVSGPARQSLGCGKVFETENQSDALGPEYGWVTYWALGCQTKRTIRGRYNLRCFPSHILTLFFKKSASAASPWKHFCFFFYVLIETQKIFPRTEDLYLDCLTLSLLAVVSKTGTCPPTHSL